MKIDYLIPAIDEPRTTKNDRYLPRWFWKAKTKGNFGAHYRMLICLTWEEHKKIPQTPDS